MAVDASRVVEVPVRVTGEIEIRFRVGDQTYELGTAELKGGDRVDLRDALAGALRELAGALEKAGREPVEGEDGAESDG